MVSSELYQTPWHHVTQNTVNTRCIYLSVDPAGGAEENLTLVPCVDFANHTANHDQSCTFTFNYKNDVTQDAQGRMLAPRSGVLGSPAHVVRQDEQLVLQYGSHGQSYLIEEYGFCLPRLSPSDPGQVIVDDYLGPLLLERSSVLRDALERWGYWR